MMSLEMRAFLVTSFEEVIYVMSFEIRAFLVMSFNMCHFWYSNWKCGIFGDVIGKGHLCDVIGIVAFM